MIVDFFINRPKFAFVIAIIILLVGLIAADNLPIAQYPQITPPQVSVTVNYPGANAETVMKTVVEPLEASINGVEDMIYMSSSAANNGMATITVTFSIGTDPSINTVNVENRVSEALSELPDIVRREGIPVKQVTSNILLFVSIYSPKETYDSLYLNNYTTINIIDRLKLVPGVGKAAVIGAMDYAMRIWLNPNRMAELKLTPSDVISAIEKQNIQVASGQIGSPPIYKDQQFEYIVQTKGRMNSVEEFENIIIFEQADGSSIRIKDIAKVDLGAQFYNCFGEYNGKPCANLAVYQRPGANALDVANAVKAEIKKLSKKFPNDLKADVAYDSTKFVSESIKLVISTLIIAFILVVLVVFIFLQNIRSTIIPTIAIPVSVIGTFAFMLAAGFSINMVTLLAMVLSIGLVVDDAIVVIENVNRIMDEEGLSPKDATKKSMKQVTSPIIATTFVLMAVFVPVAFIPGITGQLYRQFSVTVIIAVIISAFNALTLTPSLCATMLKPGVNKKKKFIFFRWFNSFFDFLSQRYNKIVTFLIKKLVVIIILFLLLLSVTYYLYSMLPTGFIPSDDQGVFMVNVQLPSGAALPRTRKVVKGISDYLSKMEGVDYVMNFAGFSLVSGSMVSNSGLIMVGLKPWCERTKPELSQAAILAKANKMFADITSAQVQGFGLPPIPGLGIAQGFQLELQGEPGISPARLNEVLNYFMAKLIAQPEIMYAYTTYQADVPQVYVAVNRAKAEKLKVPLEEIYNTLQTQLGSMYVNEFNKFGKVYQVIVQADEKYRRNVNDIKKMYVRNTEGKMVPLGALVSIKPVLGPVANHYNTLPSVSINGYANLNYSSGQALAAVERLADRVLPKDMSYSWTGTAYQEVLAGNKIIVIFILAILFLYLFVVALYESWVLVFSILLSIPIAFLGSLLSLCLFYIENNIYAQIGFILMFGLASKTAILIVEFAKKHRDSGGSILESATYAASVRYRPIVMTSLAFILGTLPLVIATGAGASSCRSVGASVFGGMILTALIGTIFVPAFYVIFQRLSELSSKKKKKK